MSWYRIDPVPPNPRYWPYGATYSWRYLETWKQVMKAVAEVREKFDTPRAFNLPAFRGVEVCMRVPERVMVGDRIFYPIALVESNGTGDGGVVASWVRGDEVLPASWDQFGEQDPDPARRLRRLRGVEDRNPYDGGWDDVSDLTEAGAIWDKEDQWGGGI